MSDRVYYSKEAEMQARRSGAVIATLAVLLGASVGVVVALLFAPRSGDEIRDELSRNAGGFFDTARQATESLAKEAGHAAEQVRERVEERVNHA